MAGRRGCVYYGDLNVEVVYLGRPRRHCGIGSRQPPESKSQGVLGFLVHVKVSLHCTVVIRYTLASCLKKTRYIL